MILMWMAYGLIVSLLLAAAAAFAERLAGHREWPRRIPWGVALIGAAVLPVWTALRPAPSTSGYGAIPQAALVILEPLRVGAVTSGMSWTEVLLTAWALASAGLALGLALGAYRLRVRCRGWQRSRVAGHTVWVSPCDGPAVVGVWAPRIVLPTWLVGDARSGPAPQASSLALALAHEREHVAAHDVRLLFAARLVVLAMPWNPALWWMLARLRTTTELDCDARVLRRHPHAARDYCETLLSLGARQVALASALALAESPSDLEQRITVMTDARRLASPLRLLTLGTLAVSAVVLACFYPGPSDGTQGPTGADLHGTVELATRADLASAPTFTPFTVRPDLLNSDDVRARLVEEYPPLLRDAGIGGTTTVWFLIDETGHVLKTDVMKASGHAALDDAAVRVASTMRFSPALNGDEKVPVWVAFPITFNSTPESATPGS